MIRLFFICFLLYLQSCVQTQYVKFDSEYIATETYKESDVKIESIISPFRAVLQNEMNTVIGVCELDLTKEQPESNLGNWAADLLKEQIEIYTGEKVDFAVLNFGGLRINSIAAGNLTKGKIYELMPFDNMLVVVEIKGKELAPLFSLICQKGGWPISKDLKITCNKDGYQKVLLNNIEINPEKTYLLATIDYLANGGDNCSFLSSKKQISTGIFLRDAVIENIIDNYKKGKNIKAKIEGRLSFEK